VIQGYFGGASTMRTIWQRAYKPDAQMFVGSAVKTFILTTFLRLVETGNLSEAKQLPIDDSVRSLDSPVFEKLTGSTEARSVLEAMISHNDNTATDAAFAAVGVNNVRQFIASAGLTSTLIPDSTRILYSYLAGAPLGVDEGWQGMLKIRDGQFFGQPRSPLNKQQTMQSTAGQLVSYYQRALSGAFFSKPATLTEFQRIQTMADAIAHIVPSGVKAYAKGGSINWEGFHALSVAGQMIVNNVPVTFCFTVNWNGPDQDVPVVETGFGASIAKILGGVATSLGS
jgi:beta-lactamase class A